ncbi:hypothetical protein [Kamptonema formosum]|uniref:hypothetical protein n=1 Tax=Kamptonema formosum TaxID=331992 RepID=UPI000345366A|nr:hypothetical protein [Oscillatoria sp. PCC 10802]
MLTAVLVLNALIAVLCCYVAWQLWKIRRVLARVADTLIAVERRTSAVLRTGPNAIVKGQQGTRQLRQQYRQLEAQLQQAEQVLQLLRFGHACLALAVKGGAAHLGVRKL